MMQRVLLTGGNGDLGQLVAPRLIDTGVSVTSLDPSDVVVPGVEQIRGSILDRELTRAVVSRSDLVIHIAAWHGVHAFTKSKSAEQFWDLNMTGTFNLLDACVASGAKKFIFISSSSVEDWPDMYGVTKRLGEELCRAYAERDQLQILVLRPRAFIPWWNTAVYSSKEEWAAWFVKGAIHISDVSEAVLRSCQKIQSAQSPMFDIFDLDCKHEFSPEDLGRWRNIGGKRFLQERFPDFHDFIEQASFISNEPPSYKDTSHTEEVLGFQAQYGFAALLEDMRNAG